MILPLHAHLPINIVFKRKANPFIQFSSSGVQESSALFGRDEFLSVMSPVGSDSHVWMLKINAELMADVF